MTPLPRLFLLSLALTAASAAAQPSDHVVPSASNQCDLTSLAPAPSWSVTAQQKVGTAAREANACLDRGDAACAETSLASVQSITLGDDERGLVALPRAELATLRSDNAAAEVIYREALASPALNQSLRREIALRLAIVLSTRGELAEALRVLDSNVACGVLTPEALTLRGALYQGLGARPLALEYLEAAMRLYQLEGKAVPAALEERHLKLAAEKAPDSAEGNDIVPLFRANPDYPQRALQSGDAGWVELEFDVTDLGTVANVRAVTSFNAVFEPSAIAAVQRWRYAPKFENGLPVSRNGVRTVITFCLDACNFRRNPPPRLGPNGTSQTPSTSTAPTR